MKKNLFYFLVLLSIASFTVTSCGNKKKKAENTAKTETAAVLQIDDVLANPDSLAGKTVTLEGICTHICEHGGKKIFLLGTDDTKTLRVDAGQEIGSFPAEVVNNVIEVTGTLVEERIDETVIRQMEEQYKNQQLEKHGDNEEAGCASEKKARGQKGIDTFAQRMQDYRDRIAHRKAQEGKEYLSFYALKGKSYKIK